MIKIDLPWIVETVSSVKRLADISEGTSALETLLAILNATNRLDGLYVESIYTHFLRASAGSASALQEFLKEKTEILKGLDQGLSRNDIVTLNVKSRQCLQVMTSELGIVPVFLVAPKEGYDVNLLTEQGNRLFPNSLEIKAPETSKDMLEVGKALVFELPTACGFHLFRVLEAILKRYWDHVSAGKARPKVETIGSYAVALKDASLGEQKIWETLSQISKLHRNPIIHPEVLLTTEEAIELLGIVRSVVGAMVRIIPEPPLQTT
jgi:hypothetical protein